MDNDYFNNNENQNLNWMEDFETELKELEEQADDIEEIEIQVLKACLGKNQLNKPNAMLSVNYFYINPDDEDALPQRKMSRNYSSIATNFVMTDDFLMADFIYNSEKDREGKGLYDLMEKYGQDLSLDNPSKEYPIIQFNLAPEKFLGKKYVALGSPVFWCKNKENLADNQVLYTIRTLFPIDEVSVLDVDKNIKRQIELEIMKKNDEIRREQEEYMREQENQNW